MPDPPEGTGAAVARRLSAPAVACGLVVGVLAVSTAAVLVRVADAPALSLAFYRCAGGAAVLAPFAVVSARRGEPGPRVPYTLLAASGLVLAVHFALWISSLSYTTVASSVVLVTMSPLFVAAGAALFLSEPASGRTWAGAALAIAGAAGIALADAGAPGPGGRALLGNAMAFGGAVTIAGYLLIGRLARRQVPVMVYATVVYGVAAAVLLVACLATGAPLAGFPTRTWVAIAGLVAGPQLLGHTVFNTLLSTVTATVVAVVVLAEPVGATVLAWLLLDELPAPGFWLSAPPLLAGVYLAAVPSRSGPQATGRHKPLARGTEA